MNHFLRALADQVNDRRIRRARKKLSSRPLLIGDGLFRRLQWQARFDRLQRLERLLPRYWQCAVIAGGTVQLGRVNRDHAIRLVNGMNYAIRYVDDSQAVIAAADPKSDALEK